MALHFYVTLKGKKQGDIKGNSPRKGFETKLEGIAWSYEIKTPRDIASGQASGKRQHTPLTFITESGPHTPQMFTAQVTNEQFPNVQFDFYHNTPEGAEEIYMTIKLTNASLASMKMYSHLNDPLSHADESDHPQLDEYQLSFDKIEIENKVGKTAGADSWKM